MIAEQFYWEKRVMDLELKSEMTGESLSVLCSTIENNDNSYTNEVECCMNKKSNHLNCLNSTSFSQGSSFTPPFVSCLTSASTENSFCPGLPPEVSLENDIETRITILESKANATSRSFKSVCQVIEDLADQECCLNTDVNKMLCAPAPENYTDIYGDYEESIYYGHGSILTNIVVSGCDERKENSSCSGGYLNKSGPYQKDWQGFDYPSYLGDYTHFVEYLEDLDMNDIETRISILEMKSVNERDTFRSLCTILENIQLPFQQECCFNENTNRLNCLNDNIAVSANFIFESGKCDKSYHKLCEGKLQELF